MFVAQQAPAKRIRGPKLDVFVKAASGVPMEEALRRADEAGRAIAPNKRLSKALVGSNEWPSIREGFACWSGTMTGYDAPDQKLGKTIKYIDPQTGVRYVFPVPEEHQGKKNVILVAEHPNFSLVKEGNDRIVQATSIDVVDRFPASDGWFLGDPKYDIPRGDGVVGSNQDARFLWRMDKLVGLVVRGSSYDYDRFHFYKVRRGVFLIKPPSDALGVVVEAP